MGSANLRTKTIRRLTFPEDGLPGIIHGKYKLRIIWYLQDGPVRFGELRKDLTKGNAATKEIAPKVLSRELKSLVDLGLIHRRAYNVVPPRVEYRLTAQGRTVLPVISKILEWGIKHLFRRDALKESTRIGKSRVIEVPERDFRVQMGGNATVANPSPSGTPRPPQR